MKRATSVACRRGSVVVVGRVSAAVCCGVSQFGFQQKLKVFPGNFLIVRPNHSRRVDSSPIGVVQNKQALTSEQQGSHKDAKAQPFI